MFDLASTREILSRTPLIVATLVRELPDSWVKQNEGPGTWSAYDVVGHLIHGERTDWIPRARIILEHGAACTFEPFDRNAMLRDDPNRPLGELLDAFAELRRENLAALDALRIAPEQLVLQGRHPELGLVTLGQLLATWVAHDLDHLVQIARVMARCRDADVGPWRQYLGVLARR
jgi:hypothetical protein